MKRKSLFTILAIALMFVLSLSVLTACNKNKHNFSSEWKNDEQYHWHECTTKKHTDTTEKLPHEFKEEIVKAADYGVVGTKKFTCKDCGYSYTADIDALGAKDNEIKLAEGKTLDKTYDGSAVDVSDKFSFSGNGEVTLMFKAQGAADDAYAATAPKNAGEYTVKVSVRATAEWKATSKTFDFAIAKKELTATGTKDYDGNATVSATLTGVIAGETVTATITMDSKNVGATVQSVMLEGADKDNYVINKANVVASITPMVISVAWEHSYDNSNILTGEPAELLAGDEATITVTMSSANVGATVQDFEITGKDAGNYSLAIDDVNVDIVKADINFEISNASAFNEVFFVGATNIPDPTTNYVEIGTGYGAKTVVWERHLGDVWSRTLTKDEVVGTAGEYRVRIQYAEGDNYNFGDAFVEFTMKAKPRNLTVKNFTGKMYDGKQVTNFTFNDLVKKFGATIIDGVENITSATESGEKYVEFREVGGEWGRNLNVANVLTNAGEYESRIGVTATDEWEAVVSEVKTFTIKPYEFVLKPGYIKDQQWQSDDSGKTFLFGQYENLIEGQKIQLWLNNEKAGLQTSGSHFVPDQKKQVTIDCFFLKIGNITYPVMENYKIVTKSPSVTTVEVTVVEKLTTGKSHSGSIQAANKTEKWIRTTVVKGYFQVGQTVEVYQKNRDGSYTKVGEAKITEIKVGNTISASGCAIPSDGQVIITLDQGFSDIAGGKILAK